MMIQNILLNRLKKITDHSEGKPDHGCIKGLPGHDWDRRFPGNCSAGKLPGYDGAEIRDSYGTKEIRDNDKIHDSDGAKNQGTRLTRDRSSLYFPAKVAFAFVILALVMVFTPGQDLYGQTLDDYLVEAAENNPGLRARFYVYQAALERVPQVGALPDPQLSFGYYIRPMEFPMGDQRADLTLMQMFPWFGTLAAREDAASRMAMARYEAFLDSKNRLFYDVKSVWYELYELEREIVIMNDNLDLLRELEELSLMRFQSAAPGSSSGSMAPMSPGSAARSSSMDSGTGGTMATATGMAGSMPGMDSGSSGSMQQGSMGSGNQGNMQGRMGGSMQGNMRGGGMSDVLRVRMEINEMENMVALLVDSRAPLTVRFNKLLNRPAGREMALPDTLDVRLVTIAELALLDNIISDNPMVRMLDQEAGAFEVRERIARMEGRPSFGAGLNYMIFSPTGNDAVSMGGNNMVMPMVTMTIPIYRQKYRAREREARLSRESVLSSREDLANELSIQLSEALRNLADAERRRDLYVRQTDLADKSMDILITEYSGGLVRFEEVLRLQEQLLDYRLQLLRAVTDHNRSVARLDMLTATELSNGGKDPATELQH
jgi:outer membrane protein TolC